MGILDLRRRAPTVRQSLAMLLAACILPAAIAAAVLLAYSYQRERAGIEMATRDVARALMQAIDRELASAQGALQALATSPNLSNGELDAFYRQAIDVLQYRPGNVLVLSDRSGRQVVNTHMAPHTALPFRGNQAQLKRVIDSGQPAVSDLYFGATVQRPVTSVDVPVRHHGRVQYVLSMQYFGERLGAILERQNIPPGSVASILDSSSVVVWSSGSAAQSGTHASSALAAALARAPEGIIEERSAAGTPLVTVFSRSSVSKWAVVISLQRSALNEALWKSLAWIALGALALFGAGLALVGLIGGRMADSIRGLVGPAIALGYGQAVTLPRLRLQEANDVGHALVQAALLLRERTAQRDEAAGAERAIRESTRGIEQSEAFLRGIFEETPDAMFLVGPDCRVVRVNAKAEQMFGYPAGRLAGVPIDALLFESGAAAGAGICQQLQATPLRRGLGGERLLRALRRDGSAFPVDAMASPLHTPQAVLSIVTVRDVTESWQKEEALRRALNDKNTLLKELYHRVKNNLQLVNSLFNLQVRELAEGDARTALVEAAGRVRAMALVHERLYQSGNLSSIALDEYVRELCTQLARAASAEQRGISVRVEVAALEIGLDAAVPLGLLLNELVSNSLKHAFPDGRGGTITVRLGRAEDSLVCLTVADDGVGLPPEMTRTFSQTLGLKLVVALSEQLRGNFTLQNLRDCGACATLLFRPAAAITAPEEAVGD